MKVTVKESCMVRPAAGPRQRRRVWLSNMDLLQLKTRHLKTIYLYNDDNFFDPEVMKEALSEALAAYYPLAGRLGRDGGDGRLVLDCSGGDDDDDDGGGGGGGVVFEEAEADVGMSELGDFLPGREGDDPEIQELLRQLVPAVDYSRGISSYPLLLLRVTKFKCGGACLGIAMHHIVCDGGAALNFISTWSEMARGLSGARGTLSSLLAAAAAPFLDRTLLRARQPAGAAAPKFHHTEYDPHPTLIENHATTTAQPPTTVAAIVKLTQAQLDALKKKAHLTNIVDDDAGSIAIASEEVEGSPNYTTYEVLAAHIWRCTTKARRLPDDQPTKLSIPVDGRSRLDPPLPPGYFGNVVFHATPTALAGELASEPVAATAGRIRTAIERMDDEYLRSAVDFLEGNNNGDEGVMVMLGPGPCRSPNLKLVSWMRLPFERVDFGFGRPWLARLVEFNEVMGYILPRSSGGGDDGDGGGRVSMAICLEVGAMEGFQRLFQDV